MHTYNGVLTILGLARFCVLCFINIKVSVKVKLFVLLLCACAILAGKVIPKITYTVGWGVKPDSLTSFIYLFMVNTIEYLMVPKTRV